MIYLRLAGGIGNQLYQLAAAAILSRVRGDLNAAIPLVNGLLQYEEPREPDSLRLLQPNGWMLSPKTSVRLPWRALSLNLRAGRWVPFLGVSDRNFWRIYDYGGGHNIILDGYFQHGWTPETFGRALKLMPVRQIDKRSAARLMTGEVAVHVRGGDFLGLPRFQVASLPFYVEAVKQCMTQGFTRFAVITDDPIHATSICNEIKLQCPQAEFRMLERAPDALQDFDTIRSAPARIIGNSTFAWWATALGSSNAPTWSPSMFTTDDPRDFFLPNERQIPCVSM